MISTAHVPVLEQEAVDQLLTDPDGRYVDATFGRGGHSRRILERLSSRGRLLAIDRDPAAREAARQFQDPRFSFFHGEFSGLDQALATAGWPAVNGVLIDLGVSSPQLDDASRGFSFRADGPLDMRMNHEAGQSASQWLAAVGVDDLKRVLRDYGDERFAAPIAKAIVAGRQAGRPLVRTAELAALVATAVPARNRRDPLQHPATRTFQAIRIFINRELEEVALILPKAAAALLPGGRLAVISFHSLEDRIVKQFMTRHASPDAEWARMPVREADLPLPALRLLGRIDPGDDEVLRNPRSRSAHLRVAERTVAPWRGSPA
jgi:16S rRNA (cytosine1402-N4)-methyltransferase